MTLKLRLILAVSLLGAVVLGMFLATWTSTDSLQADALVVNLAGRQRMLTQRMAKDALLGALSGGGADNAAMKSLRDGADLFQSTMTILEKGGAVPVNGDPKGPKVAVPHASAEAAALLGQAFSKWKEFQELAAQVAGGKNPEQAGRVAALAEETVTAMSKAVLRFQAESEGKIATLLRVQVAGIFMALLALGGFVYILRNQLMQPLRRLVEYASRVERGDEAVQLQGEFSQELDVLARGVRSMVATLRETLTSCQGKELEAQTQAEAARAAEREASARDEALGQILAAMRTASSSAEDLSAKVSRAIEELSSEIDTVDKGVVIQRDRMTETAAAVEEMNATVMEVARNASNAAGNASDSRRLAAEGADGVGRAVTGIRQMESRILGLKETMARLGVEAENIGRIMNVISDIADQTNLLALNAAIEAARAGDAGRGFAVVADEVRKLAEKTMQATREVGSAIGAIQETTRQNVAAVEHAAQDIVAATGEANAAGERMSSIVTIVEQTAGQVESIAAAAEEQSAASEQINQAVSQVTRVATETAENMTRSAGALTRIISLVEDLNGVVRDLSRNNAADARAGSARAAASLPAASDSRRLLEWNDKLSVNINSIDDEHRVLVNLMNELHAAMRDNKDRRVMGEILDRLKDYAVNHFETEERHFDKHNYPDRDAHIAQHQAFVGKVLDFYREFKAGRATVTLDLMKFLKDWLQTHIMTVDKKYGPYLKQKGVR